MYAKLSIYLKSQAGLGIPQDQNENVNNKFYFDNWLQLYRVTNIFESGLFLQQLDLLRHSEMV
jgi:hypothetical protein